MSTVPSNRMRSVPRCAGPAVRGDRRRHAQVVAVVFQAFAHLDDIPVPLGRQQPHLGPLRSSRALVATVVPWTMRSVSSSNDAKVFVEFCRQES